jgi:hypothetical protein
LIPWRSFQTPSKINLEQIEALDILAPGYVAVIELGTPQAQIVEKGRM